MSRDPAAETYFAEVASWEVDKTRAAARTVRLMAWSGALGWVTALAACGALLVLMPLKRVEPFVVRVDNTTGIVDVVPTVAGAATPAEAVTRYFLSHYVQTCERFNFATAESDYEECSAFHSPARNQAWAAQWDRANPSSPLNVHKDGSTVRAQVSAVSFFKRGNGLEDLAQVRYVRAQRASGGAEGQVSHWITTIQYTYAAPSKSAALRRWNPLGFKIIEFRAEPEVAVAEEPTTAPPPAARSAAGARP